MVDGLQQGITYSSFVAAKAAGRAIAIDLGGSHEVQDTDGSVLEHHVYGSSTDTFGRAPGFYLP
ncbi:hypothetical protein [Cellulomonas timonensis]|uniref:hypothetical protein n=1 Tax=Cellulomonas timonensis TaxID=1689271 RepID=UPI000836777D|nr:hypothetical protein [Cellulomonas timonensis]